MQLIISTTPPSSLAGSRERSRAPLRVGVVQHRWRESRTELVAVLRDAIAQAASSGARIVFCAELTLSRYPADVRAGVNPGQHAEDLHTGPTLEFAAAAAAESGVFVQASLYERVEGADGLGFNSSILVAPTGEIVGHTYKMHIPVTAGYYENTYFRGGPDTAAYPVYRPVGLDGTAIGLPTCWDEWFPEVARAYSLAGAELLVYPTAIGSEPTFPDFDTQPLWQTVIVGNGISNGTFMVVPNRTGDEGSIRFYGSSFVSDPYGRVLVQAPRNAEATLVTDLDLEQRRDWLDLFPFLSTRRPESYAALGIPVDSTLPYGALS